MDGWKSVATIGASLVTALALCTLACFLPDDPYQRWQLVDGTSYDHMRWSYERIRFDQRPVDIAIVGPSKSMLGISPVRIEQQLAARGITAHAANFSMPAAGRNAEWAIADELLKWKDPKVIVIGVDGHPEFYGHPMFRTVAPTEAIMFPPALFLHNYFSDVVSLPSRQVKLFVARFFPGLFGLRKSFDPAAYARSRSDFNEGVFVVEGKTIDMEKDRSEQELRPWRKEFTASALDRFFLWCCNEGDDHTYIRSIAAEAKARGVRLLFVFLPVYKGWEDIEDRDFLARYGDVLDNGALATDRELFYNWTHLNHKGADVVSDKVARAISDMRVLAPEEKKTE